MFDVLFLGPAGRKSFQQAFFCAGKKEKILQQILLQDFWNN
jgi:hypothetical protein